MIEADGSGSRSGRYYMLGADYYRNADNPNEYIHRKEIDFIRHSELVL